MISLQPEVIETEDDGDEMEMFKSFCRCLDLTRAMMQCKPAWDGSNKPFFECVPLC